MRIGKALSAVFFLGLTFNNAEAAIATAEANIDWSSFSVVGLSVPSFSVIPNPIVWNSQNSDAWAYAWGPSSTQSTSAPAWGSLSTASTGTASTFSWSNAIHSYAEDSNLSAISSADSYGFLSGNFTTLSSGLLVFSVDYTLNAALTPGNGDPNYASSGVSFEVSKIASNVGYQSYFAHDDINLDASTAVAFSPLSKAGKLVVSLYVNANESYNFSASSHVNTAVTSAVPLPSAAWLFLSSFIGFLGLNRRKATNA